jgi:hypothetical protein
MIQLQPYQQVIFNQLKSRQPRVLIEACDRWEELTSDFTVEVDIETGKILGCENEEGLPFVRNWKRHAMFETREEIDAREKALKEAEAEAIQALDNHYASLIPYPRRASKPKSASLERMLGRKKRRRI